VFEFKNTTWTWQEALRILRQTHDEKKIGRGRPILPEGNTAFLSTVGSFQDTQDIFHDTEGRWTSGNIKLNQTGEIYWVNTHEVSGLSSCSNVKLHVRQRKLNLSETCGICLSCQGVSPDLHDASRFSKRISWLASTMMQVVVNGNKKKQLKVQNSLGYILIEYTGRRRAAIVPHGNSHKLGGFTGTKPSVRKLTRKLKTEGLRPMTIKRKLQSQNGYEPGSYPVSSKRIRNAPNPLQDEGLHDPLWWLNLQMQAEFNNGGDLYIRDLCMRDGGFHCTMYSDNSMAILNLLTSNDGRFLESAAPMGMDPTFGEDYLSMELRVPNLFLQDKRGWLGALSIFVRQNEPGFFRILQDIKQGQHPKGAKQPNLSPRWINTDNQSALINALR